MKKLLIGLLMVVVFTSVAVAGPIEQMFKKDGYTKAVYDILVKEIEEPELSYAQGLAIGPHHILTALHTLDVRLEAVYVVSRELSNNEDIHNSDNEDIHNSKYVSYEADVVAIGSRRNKLHPFDKDWAILEVDGYLRYWMVAKLGGVEVGDVVYNLSGVNISGCLIIPTTVVGKYMTVYGDVTGESFEECSVWKVLVVSPRTQHGDSGSPVFTKDGTLIGIVTGGNERLGILTPCKVFRRSYNKYKGK